MILIVAWVAVSVVLALLLGGTIALRERYQL